METGAPLWSPTPLHATAKRIVCSWVKGVLCMSRWMNRLQPPRRRWLW